MVFSSYSQNFEDIILWRALKNIKNGFYVDVGAADPIQDSVTNAFYQRGWRGINIEPQPYYHERLLRYRPRDLNLPIALGETPGEVDLFIVENEGPTGLSTLRRQTAEEHQGRGFVLKTHKVQVRTLQQILAENADGDIHFLKIDVEDFEKEVLVGADFAVHRPWIVVVEATRPDSPEPKHEAWEGILIENEYEFVWFDGLNRFYLARERLVELGSHFQVPPNVFDRFELEPGTLSLEESTDELLKTTAVQKDIEDRIRMTARCRDVDSIPKVSNAGMTFCDDAGDRYQVMHNGLRVVADGYCGDWMTRLIQLCRGHHEPQEELAFHKVLQAIPQDATMLELGGAWSFYSLWFLQGRPAARSIIVEPDPKNLEIGRKNAALNGSEPEFLHAFVAQDEAEQVHFQTEYSGVLPVDAVSVAGLFDRFDISYLDILHCDAQGAELDALKSVRDLFKAGRIGWLFISTHGDAITGDPLTHQRCLDELQRMGAVIEVEYDVMESFSGDGLIVARHPRTQPLRSRIEVSRNRYCDSLFRNPIFDLQAERQRKGIRHIHQFVEAAYQSLLLRDADVEGREHFAHLLNEGGINFREFFNAILGSAEFEARHIEFLKNCITSANSDSFFQYEMLTKGAVGMELSGFHWTLKNPGPLGGKGENLLLPPDRIMTPEILLTSAWEVKKVEQAKELLNPDNEYLLIDVGANVGLFTRQMLNAVSNITSVLCVEPQSWNFNALKYNLSGYSDRAIDCFNMALSDVSGTLDLHCDPKNMGNHSLNLNAMDEDHYSSNLVEVQSVQEFLRKNVPDNDQRIVWKSDTQGHDEVLLSCIPKEFWERVDLAIIECWRIAKPQFDHEAFKEVIDSFSSNIMGNRENISGAEVLKYIGSDDREFEDLLMWK